MMCLLPTPSLWRQLPPCSLMHLTLPCASNAAASASSRVQAGGKKRRHSPQCQLPSREAAIPRMQLTRGVAKFFPMRRAALFANQHRTDEASRPEEANRMAGCIRRPSLCRPHRRLSAVQLRGSLSVRRYLGSIPCLKPSRSCPIIQVLFLASEMSEFMAAHAKPGLGRRRQDRNVAPPRELTRRRRTAR